MATPQSPELQHIKSRNRRRLIGAIAILAALVVFAILGLLIRAALRASRRITLPGGADA